MCPAPSTPCSLARLLALVIRPRSQRYYGKAGRDAEGGNCVCDGSSSAISSVWCALSHLGRHLNCLGKHRLQLGPIRCRFDFHNQITADRCSISCFQRPWHMLNRAGRPGSFLAILAEQWRKALGSMHAGPAARPCLERNAGSQTYERGMETAHLRQDAACNRVCQTLPLFAFQSIAMEIRLRTT